MQPFGTDSAILVIDVQRAFFRAKTPPFEGARVISCINQITLAARKAGAPVFLVQHEDSDEVPAFSEGWHLDPELQVAPEDLRLRKTTCDAFYRTSLETELRSRGIRKVVLAGFATEFCLDSTLRAAASKEFEVLVVADAHTTNDNPLLSAKQVIEFHNWAWSQCASAQPIRVLAARDLN